MLSRFNIGTKIFIILAFLAEGSILEAQENLDSLEIMMTMDNVIKEKDSYYYFEKRVQRPEWFNENDHQHLYYSSSTISIEGKVEEIDDDILILAAVPVLVLSDHLNLTLIQGDITHESIFAAPASTLKETLNINKRQCSPTNSQIVTVDWSGGFCRLCENNPDYSCNVNPFYFTDWNNGTKTFNDPVPTGALITEVDITVYGAIGCSNGTMSTFINGQLIESVFRADRCFCFSCETEEFTNTFTSGLSGYIYGGVNAFQITSNTTICVDYVEIELKYCTPCVLPCASFPFN